MTKTMTTTFTEYIKEWHGMTDKIDDDNDNDIYVENTLKEQP